MQAVSRLQRATGLTRGLAGRSTRSTIVLASAGKGFGEKKQQQAPRPAEEASTSGSVDPVDVDAALARRRSRRKVESQVKVESAAVAQATGAAPQTPVGEAETAAVQLLGIFFIVLLVEGLVLAGSGFLPEEWDAFIQDVLYPSFSPQMLAFLGASSMYGLWKTGKLPGQKQM